jgi:hypothetical protein
MARHFFLALALAALSGCSATDDIVHGRPLPLVGLEGRWAGPVTPSDVAACGPARHGIMVISGGTFAFDPFSSIIIMHGTVGDDDALHGTVERPGGDGKMLRLDFTGAPRAAPDGTRTIGGTLTSGPCTWQVSLGRG